MSHRSLKALALCALPVVAIACGSGGSAGSVHTSTNSDPSYNGQQAPGNPFQPSRAGSGTSSGSSNGASSGSLCHTGDPCVDCMCNSPNNAAACADACGVDAGG